MGLSLPRWAALERARDHLTEAQWDALRIAAVLAGLAVVSGCGYWLGRPAYRHWQNRVALTQARTFAEQGDYRSMLLALRRATEMEPEDRRTWEEVARELAAIGSPEELYAQEALTRLAPADPAPRLALAQEALRFGRFETAHSALESIDPSRRGALEYHRLSAALALAEGRPGEMKRELAALLALAPDDANAQFSYAALRMWSADPAEAKEGQASMARLAQEPAVRVRATIELVGFTARQRDPAAMHAMLQRLLTAFAPGAAAAAAGSDVRALNLLLEAIKRAATSAPTDTALTARWLADLGHRDDALRWLESLPAGLGAAPAAAAMAAQLAAEEGNDSLLARRLFENAWGRWPREVWIAAIAAHHAQGEAAMRAWNQAILACGDSLDAFRNLGRLASIWKNPVAAEAAWSAILDRDPTVQWAFQTLQASYLERRDYSALLSLYARRAEHLTNDEEAAANWILLACVLDRTSAAVDTRAEALSSSTPANIAAKAAVLWRLERPRQAEAKLDQLSADDRRGPVGSFWMALVESDLGNMGAARIALADAQRSPRSPPEEELLHQVAARLR